MARLDSFFRLAVWLIGLGTAAVAVPYAFGLVPTGAIGGGCRLGQTLGTEFACYTFLWNTTVTAIFIGIIGPLIGMFLVHREMALIGETLAHTAFAGVALGTLLFGAAGWDARLLLVAIIVAVIGALGVQFLTDHTDLRGDVPIAIVLTGSFAVGVLLIDLGGGFAFVDINSYLFGSISITDDRSVALMAVLSLLVVGLVAVAYKPLLYITFDEQAARVARINVRLYNFLLIVLTALVIVGSMQILGVILVAGMLVIPVAAASQLCQSFGTALYAAVVFGVFSALSGVGLSWSYSLRPGATIVVIAIGVYLLAVAVSSR